MIAGLILAAGASRRMGTPKTLLRIGTETFLERLIRVFSQTLSPVIVVGRHALDLPPAAKFVLNPDPERGMLSSLQCGLQALPATASGVVFTPVDYPNFQAETVARLVATFRKNKCDAVIPVHDGIHGHPVCVSARVIQELLSLPLDAQARDVIHRHRGATIFVEVEDPGIATDIDTPEDYRMLAGRGLCPS